VTATRWRALVACLALAIVVLVGARRTTRVDPRDVALEVRAAGCSLVPLHGSATAIGSQLVVTAAHVVAGATGIDLAARDGSHHAATIAAIDTDRDVAILRAPSLHRRALPRRALTRYERGSFVGFGTRGGHHIDFTVARIVSITSEDIYVHGNHERAGYDLTAVVVPGDSGAGLISTDGHFGGLVWATTRSDSGEAFAIATSVVDELLLRVGPDPAPAVGCP
jgi:S1-C subfamily serine protease